MWCPNLARWLTAVQVQQRQRRREGWWSQGFGERQRRNQVEHGHCRYQSTKRSKQFRCKRRTLGFTPVLAWVYSLNISSWERFNNEPLIRKQFAGLKHGLNLQQQIIYASLPNRFDDLLFISKLRFRDWGFQKENKFQNPVWIKRWFL